jgi:hypothetical protein
LVIPDAIGGIGDGVGTLGSGGGDMLCRRGDRPVNETDQLGALVLLSRIVTAWWMGIGAKVVVEEALVEEEEEEIVVDMIRRLALLPCWWKWRNLTSVG